LDFRDSVDLINRHSIKLGGKLYTKIW